MTHIPVLLKESIEILNPKEGEFFIDGTIGSGGHSAAILEKIGSNGKLLGIDWDEKAIKILKAEKLKSLKNIILVNGNYADLPEILENINKANHSVSFKADGLIVDLGFSSTQIESSRKGFSFLRNEPLDMRYDNEDLTAAEVVNSFSEKDLADLIFKYGEERFSRQIAKKIVDERKKERILTTFQLVEIIKKAVPKNYERGRIHPATRVFQALRIYVNQELENLETLLKNLEKILKPQGRAAIISFHSLEDRLVKNYFRQMAKEGKAEILTKKPITASDEEIKENPRSRSAKMRAIELKNLEFRI
ncbi:16S rRNA (cytosine(1402)-N(4))-methyltransferase RsmH [Candidatus Wolfebacteria bacterium]|nr:16S rRNA (cytosine(1402)-N(4))-methyltransferase RsmH [Candidatus Wolfebacteria bacterium]